MIMAMKINKLEIENVKRVKAVKIEPSANGLTIIGGDNNQGKTSILDSIAWALGGAKYEPTDAKRQGSVTDPYLSITMSNGLKVERKGKNSSLVVTDPSGEKGGQKLLDEFVEQLALDLPKFMEAPATEKAKTLLNIIGVGPQLAELERQEKEAYNERTYVGRTADQKEKFAKEQPYYPEAPKDIVSAADLIKQQQDILARNGERQQWRREMEQISSEIMQKQDEIEATRKKLSDLQMQLKLLEERNRSAQKTPKQLEMESTAELETSINSVEEINRKVRANLDKDKAEDDAKTYRDQYDQLSDKLTAVRKQKMDLLQHADLPLPGLSVVDGELTYQGQKWDNMSGSDRLKVSTAIVRKLNPNCGFVLMDKLEQMDMKTLKEFGAWLDKEGLQAIATRVSTGEECQIIIEDGYAVKNDTIKEEQAPKKTFTPGTF
jgi:hypothetical protein